MAQNAALLDASSVQFSAAKFNGARMTNEELTEVAAEIETALNDLTEFMNHLTEMLKQQESRNEK